jgi:CRP-like cAMP-binding protein
MKPTDNIEILKDIPLFRDLTNAEKLKLIRICQKVGFRGGETIFEAGDIGDALYVVRDGSVGVIKPGTEVEDEEFITELGPGEIFGEMALFEKMPRSATIRGINDGRLFRIKREYFDKLLEDDHELALKVYKRINVILCHRLRETTEELATANRVISAASLEQRGM